MAYRLGVDLGTTFTAAASSGESGPTVVGLGNRALQIPSVLFLKPDGTFLVGEAAELRAAAEPERVVREFKRRMGDEVPIIVAGTPFSSEVLTAELLRWVLEMSAERLGEQPDEVVLTHPATWGPYRLELLDQVASMAGVPGARHCSEPEAAAAEYASHVRMADGDRVAVYDLGGGTFDTCVLEKSGHGFTILGEPEGIEHLGGVDFDEAVFEHVLEMAGLKGSSDLDDPAFTPRLLNLRRQCVEAKEALSADVEVVISVPLGSTSRPLRLTRAEFEALIRPTLGQTVSALQRTIHSAGIDPASLRGILLVGGSSRIPAVSEVLQQELSLPTVLDAHPKHDVALGAARTGSSTAHAETTQRPRSRAERQRRTSVAAAQVASGPGSSSVAATSFDTGQPKHAVHLWPIRGWSRIIAASVLMVVVVTVTVLLLPDGDQRALTTGSRESSTGANSATPLGTASPTSENVAPTPDPTGTARPLPQSAVPLSDSTIVWPRERNGNWDIATIDTQTGREVRITTSGEEDTVPVIARDRRTVIYSRRGPDGGLRVVGADGNGDRELFAEPPPGCGDLSRPAWGPTSLAVVCASAADADISLLSLVTLDGRVIRQLDHGTLGDPAVSPDGSAVVYWKSAAGRRGLYSVATDGSSKPVRLTNGSEGVDADPVISPDGKQVAFRRQTSGPRVIMTMAFDGRRATSTPRARTRGPNDQDPSWSPDGRAIAYKHGPDDNADLWVVDLESGRATQVIDNAEPDTAPAWTTR